MAGYRKLYLVDSLTFNKLNRSDGGKKDSVSETKETESKTKITKYNSGVMQTKITEPYNATETSSSSYNPSHIPSPPKTAFVSVDSDNIENNTESVSDNIDDQDYDKQMDHYRERLRRLKDDESMDSDSVQLNPQFVNSETQTVRDTQTNSAQTISPSLRPVQTQTVLPESQSDGAQSNRVDGVHQDYNLISNSLKKSGRKSKPTLRIKEKPYKKQQKKMKNSKLNWQDKRDKVLQTKRQINEDELTVSDKTKTDKINYDLITAASKIKKKYKKINKNKSDRGLQSKFIKKLLDKKKHISKKEDNKLTVSVPDEYDLIPDKETLGKRARYISKKDTTIYKKSRSQPYKKTKKSKSD